ncbi:DUF757-domain-containing protein [Phellopilus nigrolimitatus]|nr:DUF757-domain-containing protein [Phellopilus nigrolimitatus]
MTTQFDPNTAQNAVEIEKQFAVKAVEHAQVYWNLLEKVKPTELRLTKIDDEIFEDLSAKFPELVEPPYDGLIKLDEEVMKSSEGKKRWREFIEAYKDKVKDYNFGSLIRMDCKDEYGERNTIFGVCQILVFFARLANAFRRNKSNPNAESFLPYPPKFIKFCAFEIARNRLGLNDDAHELAIREAEKERKQKEKERLEAEKAKKGKAKRS